MHFEITFPKNYPNSPPKIMQEVSFTSPFFSGKKFQSEMTEESEWCTGYSVFSIIIQMQTCFWESEPRHNDKIKAEMEKVRTFKCTKCEHDASENKIWPPFECVLEDGP
jgi:ubiquitin-protein ligase